MPKHSLTIRWQYLTIALLPIVVFYVGDQLMERLGNFHIQIDPSSQSLASVDEAAHRYFFFSCFLLYAFVCVSIIGIFFADLFSNFHRRSQKRIACAFAALASPVV